MKIAIFLICVITQSTIARKLQFGFTEGGRVPGDALLFSQHFENDGLFQGVTDEFWWPNSDGTTRYFNITQLRILDYNPHMATITKLSGGVGKPTVNYRFDSPFFRGFDIEVNVWGVFIGPC